jgi:hypothetical protein
MTMVIEAKSKKEPSETKNNDTTLDGSNKISVIDLGEKNNANNSSNSFAKQSVNKKLSVGSTDDIYYTSLYFLII